MSIIIVSWNTQDLTTACVRSILLNAENLEKNQIEIIVVDNNSCDDTVDSLKKSFPDITIIENSENLGFGKANNLAIAKANGNLLFFLNSDTTINNDTLKIIFRRFDQSNYLGVLGCKLIEANGSIQKSVRGYPSFLAFLYSDTPLSLLPLLRKYYTNYRLKNFNFDLDQSVETVMGAAMVIPKKVIEKVGGFDPRFFMYFEEVDLCKRIGDAGYDVRYCPAAVVTHIGGASSSQARSRMMLVYRKSMLTYFRKHNGRFKTALFSLIFKPFFLVKTLVNALIEGSKASVGICLGKEKEWIRKYKNRCRTKIDFLIHDTFTFINS